MKGVAATAVGYTGGTKPNPSYREVCAGSTGHAEAVLVEFDPKRLPYSKLLESFVAARGPRSLGASADASSQYRSGVFVRSRAQRRACDALLLRLRGEGLQAGLQIADAGRFWLAEEYHQQYFEKQGFGACEIP